MCKNKRWMTILLLLLCSAVYSYGQSLVTGTVLDELNEPVIGATIQVKGGSTDTITDIDGKFKLNVFSEDAVLTVSFVGYESQDIALKGRKTVKILLKETYNELQEVTVVAYGTQKKETLTGAISSVKTDALLRSPNPSIANSLAGQISGLSSVSTTGQPGKEDPAIYIRGVGSLTEGASSPLILVDGVERSFFQMDPNEIESVTVLKDASATAVFGVRGANGVVLVTTRRGTEGKTKIQLTSSVGLQQPTRNLEMADSYTFATLFNEKNRNDHVSETFGDYDIERYRLGDDPIMFPSFQWRDYLLKNTSIQTQHNVNISGGTKDVHYFISAGFLYQDGLLKQFDTLDYNNNYNYTRYNYRANLDFNLTSSTTMKLGLGGIVGVTHEPNATNEIYDLFHVLDWAQPFCEAGVIGDKLVITDPTRYTGVLMGESLSRYYGHGYRQNTKNTMNMDLVLNQKLDFITKGLSIEVKGAYNTSYTTKKKRIGSVEKFIPYYQGKIDDPTMDYNDPAMDKTIVYKVDKDSENKRLGYEEDNNSRNRDWYFEASLRYNRKFGDHNVGSLLLYNQSKKYYPAQWTSTPTAYVGFVGRVTYDYKSKYVGEVDFGYNGSENFAPGKRFGAFPAGSIGWVISEESFMKKQKVVDYLKVRASVGLVGNDNISNYRFLFLANSYDVDLTGGSTPDWDFPYYGYYFGFNNNNRLPGALEKRLGNPDITWEKALKSNIGLDVNFLNNRLRISADVFFENRKDILINRSTIPLFSSLDKSLIPVVNMGKVKNKGYEIDVKWNDNIQDVNYWINANVSYSKNKIVEQDEVEPNEPYMWRTGKPVGTLFGYVFERFYNEDDFADAEKGVLKEEYVDPQVTVFPGDCMYADLNHDGVIDADDQMAIGHSTRPAYVFGLNYGVNYKGWSLTMNWTGAAERSLMLNDSFRQPFGGSSRGLMQFHADNRWTKETAGTATVPRFSDNSKEWNSKASSLWVKDGSYLKLKTLQLGYTFSNNPVLKKIGISQLGLTCSAYNLLTFDHFKIQDPESKPNDNNTYPITKTYSLGVNITF